MWIDRPDMTIDVDWDVKQQTKQKKKMSWMVWVQTSEFLILTTFCVWAGWIKHYRVKTPEI